MGNWLSRLVGHDDAAPALKPAPVARRDSPRVSGPDDRSWEEEAPGPSLNAAQVEFLTGLIDPPEQRDLDDFTQDDRAFIAGIQKRLLKRELELPVLPDVAIRLSRMLREGVLVAEYVALLNGDPALSVEVLKTANSAFYGSGRQLTTLQDAVVRIGLVRLQSILMVAHLRATVLKGGPLQVYAELLLDMAMPIGTLAGRFAKGHATEPDMCFMRGVLLHVEHLVIIGAVAEVARDFRRPVVPSIQALHQAFVRFGGGIRLAVASEWNLTDLLVGSEDSGIAAEYDLLRRVLVSRWLRLLMPPTPEAWGQLETATAKILPRVPRGRAAASAPGAVRGSGSGLPAQPRL